MSDINRIEELELIDRLNAYEATVPAYRVALATIAAQAPEVWAKIAQAALDGHHHHPNQ